MTRLMTKPVPWPASFATIATALALAILTASGRLIAQSKLDTSRFVADSTNGYWKDREADARLARMDTTLQLICVQTNCRAQTHP